MAHDANGRFVRPSRPIASGVTLLEGAHFAASTRTALKSIPPDLRTDGALAMVLSDRSRWVFDLASTVADTSENLVLTPSSGTGRWLRADHSFVMKLAVSAALANNAVIHTVPEGFALRLAGLPYWEVVTPWTGGSSSAIGISSSRTGFTADGALLGGAAGDVLAGLTAGIRPGTIGTGVDTIAEQYAGLFVEGDTFIYDEITSAFTAGDGFACIPIAIAVAPLTP